MNRPSSRWFQPKLLLVSLLIISLLGPFNSRGILPVLSGYSFVEDSANISKSLLQLFDEGKAGEERSEKDTNDDFEEKLSVGQDDALCQLLARLDAVHSSFRIENSERQGFIRGDLPIYLSHHAILI